MPETETEAEAGNVNRRVEAPVWSKLRVLVQNGSEKAFRLFLHRMAEDTKRAERDPAFKETMMRIYAQMMTPSEEELDEADLQGFQAVARVLDHTALSWMCSAAGLTRAWAVIPRPMQAAIVRTITRLVTSERALLCVDDLVGVFNKGGGAVVMVVLSAVYLSYQAVSNLRQWWRGEISGARCAKNIIDSLGSMAGGVGGGVAGAAIGSAVAGPLGTLAGGVIGSLVGAHAANILLDRLTQTLFGVPKTVAEENAYAYLGVPMTASNSEVNTAFRRLCLKHHPDKGGRAEEFYVVQVNMATIKVARGDL